MCSIKYTDLSLQEKELNSLLNEWDPIGILPFEGGPEDEYTCFIHPILSILKDDKGIENMIGFLESHLREHMGISMQNKEYTSDFVGKIYTWWGTNSNYT